MKKATSSDDVVDNGGVANVFKRRRPAWYVKLSIHENRFTETYLANDLTQALLQQVRVGYEDVDFANYLILLAQAKVSLFKSHACAFMQFSQT